MLPATDIDRMLAEDMASFFADPYGYVMYNWQWGTGYLADFKGPREWQKAFLVELGQEIRRRGFDGINPVEPIQEATSSGHGIGKSALTAWLIKFIHDTRPFSKGIVTANTSDQLRTKTWAELGKWHKLSLTHHWSDYNTSRGNMSLVNRQHPESWRVDAQTCKEENSESFAGLHAASSTPFYIFDEASAVPDKIWEVSDGGLTDGEPMRFVFGNPTRNTGRFRECFGRLKHRWITRQIDSRQVEGTNKELFKSWVQDYGEDSDFVRVRIRGVFPRAGSMQFISSDLVEEAARREAEASIYDAFVMGVDVARYGDDQSIIYFRKGRDGRTHAPLKFRGLDTMQLAARVAEQWEFYRADGLFVDETGVGAGVVDRLRQLRIPVIGVNFGSKPDRSMPGQDMVAYANKRAEMWGVMRDWLKGGAIPDDPELAQDLTGVEYGYVMLDGRDAIQLEKKSDMKKRGLASPDVADALALTFAYPVQANRNAGRHAHSQQLIQTDYDPFNTPAVKSDYDPYN